MTTSSTDTGPQDPQGNADGTESHEESPETAAGDSGASTETQPETFSREYVETLRQESARHRTNAKKSDELTKRLVTSYVEQTGRLHDPTDLPISDDLLNDDGFPDREKVNEAVEALIHSKPHLAKIRPVGDVGQGRSTEGSTNGSQAFADLLRGAAG